MTDAQPTPRTPTPIDAIAEGWVDEVAELVPTVATYIGRFEHNGRLEDLSPAGHDARYRATQATLAALEAAEPVDEVDVVTKADLAGDLRLSIALYEAGAEHARSRGIILADTKFEFGLDADGTLTLGDEVLTPDSSRFWPADRYEVGRGQPSFDKQFVRDWASSTGWDRTPPAPAIPDEVVGQTSEKYRQAYELIAGEPFAAWQQRTAPA